MTEQTKTSLLDAIRSVDGSGLVVPQRTVNRVITLRLSSSEHRRAKDIAHRLKTSLNKYLLAVLQAANGVAEEYLTEKETLAHAGTHPESGRSD